MPQFADIVARITRRALKKITEDSEIEFEGEFNKTSPIKAVKMDEAFEVETLEGTMQGKAGDWLAEGVEGERWPIDADIFDKTYEKAAALVRTDTATVYAISPDQLYRMVAGGQWEALASATWTGAPGASPTLAMNKVVRLHGGAVFGVGHRGTWEVQMPEARYEHSYLRTAGSKTAVLMNLDEATVEQFRKDFLLLAKNIGRELSTADLVRWRQAVIHWRERFEKFGAQIRADLEGRARDDSGKSNQEWAKHYLKMDDFWNFAMALRDLPVDHPGLSMKYDQQAYGDMFTTEQYQERADRVVQQTWVRDGEKWAARAKRKAPAAWKYLKDLIAWTQRTGFYGGGGEPVVLNEPTTRNVTLEGFRLQFIGFEEAPESDQSYLAAFKAGLALYRDRASRVFPWLLQHQLPLEVHWGSADDPRGGGAAATYERSYIAVWYFGLAAKPSRVVHTLAHEMGHHVWRTFLTKSAEQAWAEFIRGDYRELDLRTVMAQMRPGETVFEFGDRIEREDPILHIQIESLYHNPTYKGYGVFGIYDVQKHLDAGKDPIVHVPASPITGYAAKNPEEAFCEALGKLVTWGPRTVPDSVAWMMKQLLPNMRLGSDRSATVAGTGTLYAISPEGLYRVLQAGSMTGEAIRQQGGAVLQTGTGGFEVTVAGAATLGKVAAVTVTAKEIRMSKQQIARIATRFVQAATGGKVTGNRSRVGLFIPLPADLAEQFPPLGEEDSSPSHVTLLYVGEVSSDRQEEFLEILRRVLSKEPGPVRAWLNGVDKFLHPGAGREVFYAPVRFSRDFGMVRDRLTLELQTAGFEIKNSFPLAYTPHVTLGYVDGFDNRYVADAPEGAWEFNAVQVWGLPSVEDIPLGTYEPSSMSLSEKQQAGLLRAWGPIPKKPER